MKIEVGASCRIDVWELKKEAPKVYRAFFDAVREKLTFANPAKEKYFLDPKTYFYLRRVPMFIKLYSYRFQRYFEFPIGYLPQVVEIAYKYGLNVQLIDQRVEVPTSEPYYFNGELFSYQEEAVRRWLYREDGKVRKTGILVAPTGSGKTVMGVKVFSELGQRTLVLAHTREIAKQWISSFEQFARRKFTNKKPIIGLAGMGKRPKGNEDVVIGMYQTVHKIVDDDVSFCNAFGLVLMDEADLVAAKTLYKIGMRMNSKYKKGMTATPHRKDGLDFKVHGILGPVVSAVHPRELQQEDRYVPITAFIHFITFVEPDLIKQALNNNWATMINYLTSADLRTEYIVNSVVDNYLKYRMRSIVFVERVDFAKQLATMITDAFQNRGVNLKAGYLLGEMKQKERSKVIKDKEIAVLVVTKVADRGMDVPELGIAHIVFPSANKNTIIQRIGRVRRVFEGKQKAHVHFYVDKGLDFLYYAYVLPQLRQEGAEIIWLNA